MVTDFAYRLVFITLLVACLDDGPSLHYLYCCSLWVSGSDNFWSFEQVSEKKVGKVRRPCAASGCLVHGSMRVKLSKFPDPTLYVWVGYNSRREKQARENWALSCQGLTALSTECNHLSALVSRAVRWQEDQQYGSPVFHSFPIISLKGNPYKYVVKKNMHELVYRFLVFFEEE